MLLIKAWTVSSLLKQVNGYLQEIGSLGFYGVSGGFILYYFSGRYMGNVVDVLELRKKNGFYIWFHNNRVYEEFKKYV